MSDVIQKLHHVALRKETYQRLQEEGKYGDTMDTIVSRILLEREKQKRGELVIS